MRKKKMLFCRHCVKTTPHAFVGKESMYEGMGLARALGAIVSFGMSETSWADKFWQCECCGNIKKHN